MTIHNPFKRHRRQPFSSHAASGRLCLFFVRVPNHPPRPPLFSPKKKGTKKPQRLSPIVASRQSGIERYFQQLPNVRQHDVSPPGIFRHVNKSIQAREDFLCWAIGNLHAHLINYTSTLNWLTH